MSEPDEKTDRGAPRVQAPPPVERRNTARALLRDVGGRMSWQGDAGDIACEVTVLNISGGGAAVLAEQSPQAGQKLRLSLSCDSARMDPIEGQVVETRLDSSGKRVVHVRFAQWISLDSLLERHRERRLWERYPAREPSASLTWQDGTEEKTIRGDLLNISGGGAAFASEVLPPPGVPLWLRFEAGVQEGIRIDPVESRLVTMSVDPSGMSIAHIQFVDPCPMELFDAVVEGSG